MDAFRLCVALGPLAAYLVMLGALHLSRRSWVVGGAWDLAALGAGASGLMFVGPVELLAPQAALIRFGGSVWLLIGIMYSLGVLLAMLACRPRLVLYNISLSELLPELERLSLELDANARWAGSSLSLPNLQVELHVESGRSRTISLASAHDDQSLAGWRVLATALAVRLRQAPRPASPWGPAFMLAAAAIVAVLGWEAATHPQAISQGFAELWRQH